MNRQLHIILLAIAALSAAICFTGCSTAKKSAKRDLGSEIPGDIALQTPSQRYTELCKSYADWQDVTMPVRVSVTAPKSISLSARAAMKRDKWISISVRMLGFEVASLFVDKDSVHVIDRYHKKYVSESIADTFGSTGISVADIQDLLLGRGFVVGDAGGTFTPPLSTAIEFANSAEGLMILPAIQPKEFEYGFIMAQDANRIGAASVNIKDKHAGVVTYTDPIETRQAGSFAGECAIELVRGKKMAASLKWNFSSAKWNTGEERSWKCPSGYARIDEAAIISKLTKL